VTSRYARKRIAELNVSLPAIEARFWSEVQEGRLPELDDFFPIDGSQ
jgi:hypothetical protein